MAAVFALPRPVITTPETHAGQSALQYPATQPCLTNAHGPDAVQARHALHAWPGKEKRPARGRFSVCVTSSRGVVHVELDRMRGHAKARDLGHLQLDVGIDIGIGEHATLREERTVLVEVAQRL